MRQRDQKSETRPAAATAPGLKVMTPMESAAKILAEVGQRGNLAGLGDWAAKSDLVAVTGRSRDWLEKNAAAGRIARRLEVDQAARRVRSLYCTADVQQLLEAAR